jgi:hypothetical protein
LPLEEKLRLLKEARKRQQLRNKDFRRPTKAVPRGWRRGLKFRNGLGIELVISGEIHARFLEGEEL